MIEKDTSKFKIQNQSALLRISQGSVRCIWGKRISQRIFFTLYSQEIETSHI